MDISYPSESSVNALHQNLARTGVINQQYANYSTTAEALHGLPPPSNSPNNRRVNSNSSPGSNRDFSLQPSPSASHLTIPSPRSQSAASMSPSLFTASLPKQGGLSLAAEERSLPSRDIDDVTIDDAYVDFILYCNPAVPAGTDTSHLRKIFRCLPRSEGKSFSIFTLWQLFQKFDRKELKTWMQLANELGVEPPSTEKKQSTQKVQQYIVRLKVSWRWGPILHSMTNLFR